jgi:hypothetical protein
MSRDHIHQVEQAVVMVFGFCLGVSLAMCVAAGDVLLWVATGIVLSIFSRAFFIRDLGGELLWPLGGHKSRNYPDDPLRPTPGRQH